MNDLKEESKATFLRAGKKAAFVLFEEEITK